MLLQSEAKSHSQLEKEKSREGEKSRKSEQDDKEVKVVMTSQVQEEAGDAEGG